MDCGGADFLCEVFLLTSWSDIGFHPSVPLAMKKLLLLFLVFVSVPMQAAVIGSWAQDEPSGPLIDSTGNHPPGIPTGSPTYGQPGVPNGTYGSITIGNAAGTSIEYGPSAVD